MCNCLWRSAFNHSLKHTPSEWAIARRFCVWLFSFLELLEFSWISGYKNKQLHMASRISVWCVCSNSFALWMCDCVKANVRQRRKPSEIERDKRHSLHYTITCLCGRKIRIHTVCGRDRRREIACRFKSVFKVFQISQSTVGRRVCICVRVVCVWMVFHQWTQNKLLVRKESSTNIFSIL